MTASSQKQIAVLDEMLAAPGLEDQAKAMLLLKICQMAQIMRPEVFEHYLPRLQDMAKHLPPDRKAELKDLQKSAGSENLESLSGFAGQVAKQAREILSANSEDPVRASGSLEELERTIKKRFLPFGKKEAWTHLIRAWALVNRSRALGLLDMMAEDEAQALVIALQSQKPLSEEEWQLASQKLKDIGPPVVKLLTREGQIDLQLPESLIPAVGKRLLKNLDREPPRETEEQAARAEWEKHYNCALKLAGQLESRAAGAAHQLMVDILGALSTTKYFKNWPDRLSSLRETINGWAAHESLRPMVWEYLSGGGYQGAGKDLVLSQWLAMVSEDSESAEKNLRLLQEHAGDWPTSRTWFLVVLARKGQSTMALSLAKQSDDSSRLSTIIRRAWLFTDPQSARESLQAEEFGDDPIARFLIIPETEARVEYLKSITNKGKDPLPEVMWSKPNLYLPDILMRVIDDMKAKGGSAFVGDKLSDEAIHEMSRRQIMEMERCLIPAYLVKESEGDQFKQYVRMHGFAFYSQEYLDPLLLEALVAWRDQEPDQVSQLLKALWQKCRLNFDGADGKKDTALIMNDVARRNHFKRIYTIFSVKPMALDTMFLVWLKKHLVDEGVREAVGDQIRTLTFNKSTTFLYGLLAAQEVARYSRKYSEEILLLCLKKYSQDAEASLLSAAGSLYAGDDPFKALTPPVEINDGATRQAWQLGVISSTGVVLFNALKPDEEAA